jgi:hypothetical protein
MDLYLKSLRGSQQLSMPNLPVVIDYASQWGAVPHDIRLFPAIIRRRKVLRQESVIEEGQSTCFFHPKVTASAICDVSGRMICELCTTEFEGKTVSFEALQSLVDVKGSSKGSVRTNWDSIALALAILPAIFWFFTLVTAPLALGICIFKWKEGPTGVFGRMRWRYIVAGLLALGQIVMWINVIVGFSVLFDGLQ